MKSDHIVNQNSQYVIYENNQILRNTYFLLSLTLLFSACTAGYSILVGFPIINPIVSFIVYMGLLLSIQINRNSFMGLVLTFALTGFLGATMGNILNYYISTFSNGAEMILISLGSTGVIFLILSSIAINNAQRFSNIIYFLGVGSFICLLSMMCNIFLRIPALHLALSVATSFIAGGMILWQTSQIVNGGERNYIIATVTLYVSIMNIFMTILNFLSIFIGKRE
jgi:modulator of FtsH protease